MTKRYAFLAFLTLIVLSVIGISFYSGNNPLKAGKQKRDQQRLSDFSVIKNQVENYYRNNKVLPTNLAQLSGNNTITRINFQDPTTLKPYVYKVVSKTSFELCTDFELEPSDLSKNSYGYNIKFSNESRSINSNYGCAQYQISSYLVPTPFPVYTPRPTSTPFPSTRTYVGTFDGLKYQNSQNYIMIKQGDNVTTYFSIASDVKYYNEKGQSVFLDSFAKGDNVSVVARIVKGSAQMEIIYMRKSLPPISRSDIINSSDELKY